MMAKWLCTVASLVALGCDGFSYAGYKSYAEVEWAFCHKQAVSDFDFYERLRKTSLDVVNPSKMVVLLRNGCKEPEFIVEYPPDLMHTEPLK